MDRHELFLLAYFLLVPQVAWGYYLCGVPQARRGPSWYRDLKINTVLLMVPALYILFYLFTEAGSFPLLP